MTQLKPLAKLNPLGKVVLNQQAQLVDEYQDEVEGGGDGRSGIMLYHWVGISLSSSVILVKLFASLLSAITYLP